MPDNIIEFTATITKSDERGSGAFVSFPFDLESTFGTRAQVKVQVEFDGVPYRGSIVNMGAGPCIGMLKSIREQLGKQPGDSVHVRLWKDEEPRIIETPDDLAQALGSCPAAEELLLLRPLRSYTQVIAPVGPGVLVFGERYYSAGHACLDLLLWSQLHRGDYAPSTWRTLLAIS